MLLARELSGAMSPKIRLLRQEGSMFLLGAHIFKGIAGIHGKIRDADNGEACVAHLVADGGRRRIEDVLSGDRLAIAFKAFSGLSSNPRRRQNSKKDSSGMVPHEASPAICGADYAF